MPEIPCATTQVFTPQKIHRSLWGHGEWTSPQKPLSIKCPPSSPQTISMTVENEESRFSACILWVQVNPTFPCLSSPTQCWIWDTKNPPWKSSDFIGHLQHHPKGTEIPGTTPWFLLDQALQNTVLAAVTALKILTTAFTDQHLPPGYQCKSTVLGFPNK